LRALKRFDGFDTELTFSGCRSLGSLRALKLATDHRLQLAIGVVGHSAR